MPRPGRSRAPRSLTAHLVLLPFSLLVGFLLGCVPVITPPLEVGGGGAMRFGGEAGHRFTAGSHVASLIPEPNFPLDVGAGYVQTGTVSNHALAVVHGVYLDGGPRLAGGKFWRVFAGPRAEYYFAPQGPAFSYAALGRASAELMLPVELEPVAGSSTDSYYLGVAHGMLAIGVDIEAGYQHLPVDAAWPMAGIGLHVRVPATAGLLCCAWDFKKH
jgi:hypothetical protein